MVDVTRSRLQNVHNSNFQANIPPRFEHAKPPLGAQVSAVLTLRWSAVVHNNSLDGPGVSFFPPPKKKGGYVYPSKCSSAYSSSSQLYPFPAAAKLIQL